MPIICFTSADETPNISVMVRLLCIMYTYFLIVTVNTYILYNLIERVFRLPVSIEIWLENGEIERSEKFRLDAQKSKKEQGVFTTLLHLPKTNRSKLMVRHIEGPIPASSRHQVTFRSYQLFPLGWAF